MLIETSPEGYTEITVVIRNPFDSESTSLFLEFLDTLSEMEMIYDRATEDEDFE
jgi:hypothetical protein